MDLTRGRPLEVGLLLVLVAGGFGVERARGQNPAEKTVDPPAAAPPFQPGDISIGEPIAVPFAKPADRPQQTTASPGPVSVLAPAGDGEPAVRGDSAPASAAPNGWLGMAVSESRVPGRWTVVEVAPLGPAAAAGLAVGDDVVSIDGITPRNADEVAQALTAITSGQRVRLAIVRGEQGGEVVVAAVPRPTPPATREWRSAVAAAESPAPAQPPAAAPAPAAAAAPLAPWASQTTAATAAEPVPAPLPPALPRGPRGRIALGVRTIPIDPEMRQRFGLRDDAGAYVIGVVGDLPAARAGIPPGSVIVKMNEQPVRSPDELTRLVTAGPVDRPVPVEFVLPGGSGRRADVVLQSLEEPLERALVGEAPLQPTTVPTLESGSTPRTSRRPADAELGELRREIVRLRGLLEGLERRVEYLTR